MTTPPPGAAGPERLPPSDSAVESWDTLFELDDTRRVTRPSAAQRRPFSAKFAATGAVVLVVSVVTAIIWVLNGTDEGADTTAGPATPTPQAQLSSMLPGGYAADGCRSVDPLANLSATVTCDRNTDAGGPVSATYGLASDSAALTAAFTALQQRSISAECPGHLRSPVPWRRSATPQVVGGAIYCGIQQNQPVLAWTDEAQLLLHEVRGNAQVSLSDLFNWWFAHA